MPMFRKKPVVIEAIQYTGNNYKEVAEFMQRTVTWFEGESLEIKTLEGVMTAGIGDWIIKGIKGEFYPCKDDIFRRTYEPCEDSDG
jgi:hypothetical protein